MLLPPGSLPQSPELGWMPFFWVFMTCGLLVGTLSPAPPTSSTVPGTLWVVNNVP